MKAQNVNKVEYYFDVDPGFDKGVNVPVTPGEDITASFQININTLTTGFHHLYVRALVNPYQVTIGDSVITKGGWSLTNMRTFYKDSININDSSLANIIKGEFFIDTDPGFGNGTNISFNPGSELTNLSFAADVTSLPVGFHHIYTRFKDANGNWGLTSYRAFYKEKISSGANDISNIVKGEYFIDTDPGFDKGSNIVLTPGIDVNNVAVAVDITSLPNGFHHLFTRFKNADGNWGHTNHRAFYKDSISADPNNLSQIVKGEYFIDSDPGFGNGTSIAIGAATDINNISFPLDLNDIPTGNHNLYARFLNDKGIWSITNVKSFTVEPPSGFSILIGSISDTICAGSNITIPFSVNASFDSTNTFTAQLSDIYGDFTYPYTIGSLQSKESGTISAVIPTYIYGGTGYRIRILASSPADTSALNDSVLTINKIPAKFSITGDTSTCTGSKTYSLNNIEYNNGKYIWSLSGGGTIDTSATAATINWTTAGTHTISVNYTGMCANADSVQVLKVNVTNTPLTDTFKNMLPADGNTNLSLPITFSWLPIDSANAYDIYIWPDTAAKPTEPTILNVTDINYTIDYYHYLLEYEKMYKWQIVAKKACYTLESPVQTFKLRYLPDLVVNNITLPASGFSGQSFSIKWEVKNIGQGGTLEKQWYDKVYLSKDAILEPNTDYYLGAVPNVSELTPNSSYTQTASFPLPQGIDDNFYVFVITNAYNGLYESVTTNNTQISSTTATINLTPPPDLQVTSIVPPNFIFSGQKAQIIWKVANAGNGSTVASSWTDNLYLTNDTALDFSRAAFLGSFSHTGALDAGDTSSQTATITIPEGIFGKYYLFVTTDAGKQVYEHAAENNNTTRSDSINIILTPPVDLAVTQITNSDTASQNETITIKWRVENEGGSSTAGHFWYDKIYLSKTDSLIPDSAILLKTIVRTTAVNAGEGYDAQQNATIPAGLLGDYYLFVTTGDNSIYELETINNVKRSETKINITAPDLIVSNIVVPATDSSGKQVQIEWTIKNNGSGTLYNNSITDRILLSTKPEYNSDSVVELKQFTYNAGQITTGNTITKQALINLPNAISGNYYIYIQADYNNAVNEGGKEDNNITRSTLIQITLSPPADLHVVNVQTIDSATAGDVVSLSYKVINKGNKQINGIFWADRIYISSKTAWDTNAMIYVRDLTQSKTLHKDSSYDITTSIKIPSRIGDSVYYIYVFTDAGNAVYEGANEENNVLRSNSVFVKKYPPVDIAVTNLTAPGNGSSGQPITVGWTVENKGAVTTLQSQWTDAAYLSADTIWNANDDIFIKDFIHKGVLEAGRDYTNEQTFTLPNGIEGSYYLLMVADYGNFNNDINPKNNYKAVTQGNSGNPVKIDIKLTPPSDLVVDALDVADEGPAGQPVKVTWTVKNNGDGTTDAKSWTDKIYLSKNTTLDADDIVIGTHIRSDSLLAGKEYIDSLQAILPITASGNYILIFKTDANNNVYEHLAEDNNLFTANITVVQPPVSDIIVSDISMPDSAVAGEAINIEWKVRNVGQFPATGYMKEGLYLSEDTIKDISDVLLASPETNITLAPESEVTHNYTGELNGVSLKSYHVLIHTDVLNNIYESSDSNNITASVKKLQVTVPRLFINVLAEKSVSNNKEVYYRIEVPDSLAGESLLITLKGDSVNGNNELYVKYGEVPTRAVYDYTSGQPYEGNQEITIPELKAGTYYLMVHGNTTTGNAQEINLLAKVLNFEIRYVNANEGGTTGHVTVLIQGSKLGNVTTVSLTNSSNNIVADSVKVIDPTKLYVTFKLNGSSLGSYNVLARNANGDTASLSNGFSIVAGTSINLLTNVSTPPSTRPSNVISISVQFTNAGNTDLINPILKLSSLGGAPIAFSVSELANEAKELAIPLQELNGPAGILRPGASGTIIVYAKATTALSFMLLKSDE